MRMLRMPFAIAYSAIICQNRHLKFQFCLYLEVKLGNEFLQYFTCKTSPIGISTPSWQYSLVWIDRYGLNYKKHDCKWPPKMSKKLQVYLNKRGTLKDKKVHRWYSKNVHPVRRYTVLFDRNLGRPFPFMFFDKFATFYQSCQKMIGSTVEIDHMVVLWK